MLISRLLLLVVIIVALLFCVSNLAPVTVNLIGWESPQLPLSLVLIFAFFFGFSLALLWQALRSVNTRQGHKLSPQVTPNLQPEKAEVREKKSRKWGLGKKKQDDVSKEKPVEQEQKADKKSDETVDSEAETDNITDEPTDVPAIEDK